LGLVDFLFEGFLLGEGLLSFLFSLLGSLGGRGGFFLSDSNLFSGLSFFFL
jgi:hypothetical protein